MHGTLRSQKIVLDPWELKLRRVVSCCVGAGYQSQVLLESRTISPVPTHHTSLIILRDAHTGNSYNYSQQAKLLLYLVTFLALVMAPLTLSPPAVQRLFVLASKFESYSGWSILS